MVLLVSDGGTEHCGGFLLNQEFVMTAAHCRARHHALIGLHDFNNKKNIQNISADKVFPHKDFDPAEYRNDLMLIKLSSNVTFNRDVRPIALTDHGDPAPKSCIVSGWGRHDKTGLMSLVLREVNLTLIDDESCEEPNSYCSEGEKGPGEGDSGGPLVCEKEKAYGVVSAYKLSTNGQKLYYFTKISDYRDWINSTMKNN